MGYFAVSLSWLDDTEGVKQMQNKDRQTAKSQAKSSSVLQVSHTPAPMAATHAPQGDCCQPAPMPSPPSETVVKKEQKIREVHVSAGLMEEFLRSAHLLPMHPDF